MNKKTEIAEVKRLGDEIGYGNMMHIASDLWKQSLKEKGFPESGAFVPALASEVGVQPEVSLQGEPTVCEHIEFIKNFDHSTWGKNMNITACLILIKSMLDNNAGELTIKVDGYTDGEKPKGDFIITIVSKHSEPKTN